MPRFQISWTGGGAVERAGLENQYGLRVIVGSNPTLSASGGPWETVGFICPVMASKRI